MLLIENEKFVHSYTVYVQSLHTRWKSQSSTVLSTAFLPWRAKRPIDTV